MKPGLIITITPMKPTITADHRCKPTFSFNKKIDKIVTIIGAIKDKVNASARDIKEIA